MATAQEAVRRLTIVTSAPGADQAAASLRGVAKAMDGVTVASQSQEKATLSLDQKFASIERKYVAQVRAQQDYEKIQRQVNAAVAQNPALQDRANVVLAAAKERHDQMTNSQRALGTVTSELNSQIQAAANSFGSLGAVLTAFGPVGIAAAAALGLVSLGLKQAADAALALAETAGKLKDFSETTGFTVVQLQALQKAGAQVGVSADSVSRGLERFSVAMDDVKKGTGPAFESILEINPALAKQLTQVNSLTEAWDIFAKAVKQADLEQSNKLARSVFGRSGVEITRLARANADAGGLTGLTNQLKEIDRITAAQAERWDELGDTIAENMKAARQNIVSIFAEPVLTATEKFSTGLLEASRAAKSFSMSEDLKTYLAMAGRAALNAIPIVGPAINAAQGASSLAGSLAPGPITGEAGRSGYNRGTGIVSSAAESAAAAATAQLEAQKRALSASIAEQERWNAALGAAVTPAETLRLGIDKLKLALLENKISAEQAAKGQAALNAQYSSSQFSTYIGLLGQAASMEEQVQAKRNQINDAARQGVSLSKEQIETQLRLTQAQALGTYQIDAATDAEKLRIQTLSMGTEAATSYAVSQSIINKALQDGKPLKDDEIAQIRASADAYARVKVQADKYADAVNLLSSTISSGLVTGLTDVLDGTKSVSAGFQDMSKMVIRAIEEMIIKVMIVTPLVQALQQSIGGLGGFLGMGTPTLNANGSIAGAAGPTSVGGAPLVAHTGGIVGGDSLSGRYVHPAYFDDAPRFHTGGIAGDEVPIIARRGEGVFTRGQMAALGGAAPKVNVIVNNNNGSSVAVGEPRTTSDGGIDIPVLIDAASAKNIANPGSATRRMLDMPRVGRR